MTTPIPGSPTLSLAVLLVVPLLSTGLQTGPAIVASEFIFSAGASNVSSPKRGPTMAA